MFTLKEIMGPQGEPGGRLAGLRRAVMSQAEKLFRTQETKDLTNALEKLDRYLDDFDRDSKVPEVVAARHMLKSARDLVKAGFVRQHDEVNHR